MIHLIPQVKKLELGEGFLQEKAICCRGLSCDQRVAAALKKLPCSETGAKLELTVTGESGEEYELTVNRDAIQIRATGAAGAFYAVQTLRQLFKEEQVPCLHIQDKPDFAYRGFYHDVTRGRVPTVEKIKELIDQMAYYKLNSLQLYVEHAFAFKEYAPILEDTGYLTGEELREIGAYCKENFISFIPSLSTFGHLYELLQLPQYKHLRVCKDYETIANFWHARMRHHTIDPLQPESLELIKSLIDQYIPWFESDVFNICCDETFDLQRYGEEGYDVGQLYVGFVKKIIAYLKGQGKQIMMWADILLKYPEAIEDLPEDTCFLNWFYRVDPPEEMIEKFARMHRRQIVCPGSTTWNRLCENVDVEENNICLMAEYGYRHGAEGVLNTNWGDWGNPCSMELAMYSLVLGAEKSWSVGTPVDESFYRSVNFLLYEQENGIQMVKELSRMNSQIDWKSWCNNYFHHRFGYEIEYKPAFAGDLQQLQQKYRALAEQLQQPWKQDGYRQELLLGLEGVCLMAELSEKQAGKPVTRVTDTASWLEGYRQRWRLHNKESELRHLVDMFAYYETVWG